MMKRVAVAVAGLVLPVMGFGQGFVSDVSKTGTAAAAFLEIPVGAPAIAMGSAFVSQANDASALYWNAAGVALLPQSEVLAMHTNWIADTKFDFGALVLPLGGFGTLGFSVTALTMGDMKVTTVAQPDGTGEFFTASDVSAGVSYARQLSDRFSVGFTGKYIQETIWHESANAFAMDIGTIFRTDLLGGVIIGASLSNFGTTMQLSGSDARQFIRLDPSKTGTNGQIPADVEFNSWNLPLLFQIGVSLNAVKNDSYRWTVAFDALHPSDNYESVNVGTEFAFQDFLFLRGGFNSPFFRAMTGVESEGGLSLGVGVSSGSYLSPTTSLKFDYAYRDMGRLEGIHVFSVGVRF